MHGRFSYSHRTIQAVAVLLTTGWLISSGLAYEFLGAQPGVTTEQQLLASRRWGKPSSRTTLGDAVQLDYRLRGYRQVRVWLRGGMIQTIDVSLSGLAPATVASALKLGEPILGEPLPKEAAIGPELPPAVDGVRYSAGRVALFTNRHNGNVALVRVFAATELPAARATKPNSTATTSPQSAPNQLVGPSNKSRQIVRLFAKLVPQLHLSQHPLDDQISERTLKSFLKRLDAQKLLFTNLDVRSFRREVDQLDDALRQGDLSLVYRIVRTYQRRVNERVAMALELVDMELDLTLDEEWPLANDELPFLDNDLEFREYWRKRVKYQILSQLLAGKDLEQARRQVRKELVSYRDRSAAFTDEDLLETFLSSATQAYDPHSDYISDRTWQNFLIDTRKELVGIGASLKIVDGFVEITSLITGGPADKDGRLQVGDRILAVAQGDSESFVETFGQPLNETVAFMRGEPATTVRLRRTARGGI